VWLCLQHAISHQPVSYYGASSITATTNQVASPIPSMPCHCAKTPQH
jgi:hypothetical protein